VGVNGGPAVDSAIGAAHVAASAAADALDAAVAEPRGSGSTGQGAAQDSSSRSRGRELGSPSQEGARCESVDGGKGGRSTGTTVTSSASSSGGAMSISRSELDPAGADAGVDIEGRRPRAPRTIEEAETAKTALVPN